MIYDRERQHAEERYRAIRQQARNTVQSELQEISGQDIRLTEITESALEAVDRWRLAPTARAGWSWRREVLKFRRRPRRVEVAMWHTQTLCGLALGRISDKCVIATIHYIESNPEGNPLAGAVVPYITRYLQVLAYGLGCKEVSIEQPVEALVPYYTSMGFTKLVTKGKRVIRQKMNLDNVLSQQSDEDVLS